MRGGFLAEKSLLQVDLEHRLGALGLKVKFSLTKDWTVLFGPSGSGKSTVLRAIAGLIRPDHGRILAGPMEQVLVDTTERRFVPAHLRPVRGATQTAWPFPGRTVGWNVEYGMRWRSHPEGRQDERQIVEEVLGLFRLQTLKERKVEELSGGERQRVSVARAVISAMMFDLPEQALLVLDEPFTGLDGSLRDELAVELKGWLQRWRVPVLSVSHDVAECYLLGAEVIRMSDGQVIEQGPVETVLRLERERILTELGS